MLKKKMFMANGNNVFFVLGILHNTNLKKKKHG